MLFNNAKFSLFNNSWDFFSHLKDILHLAIDEQGNKLIESSSELSKLERKVKNKEIVVIFEYFESIDKLLSSLSPTKFREIPTFVFKEFQGILFHISTNLTLIRTISAKYKENEFLESTDKNLRNLKKRCNISLKKISDQWKNQIKKKDNEKKDSIDIRNITSSQIKFSLKEKDLFDSIINNWFHLNNTKKIKYLIEIGRNSIVKDFKEEKVIKDYKNKNNYKKDGFLLIEIINNSDFNDCSTLKHKNILIEILYLLHQQNLIQIKDPTDVKSKDPAQKEIILNELDRYIQNQLNDKFNSLVKSNEIQIHLEYKLGKDLTKEIPHIIKKKLEDYQDKTTSFHEGNLTEANIDYQEFGIKFFNILDELENWMDQIRELMNPYKNRIKKYTKMIKYLRGDVDRSLKDFDLYSTSVQQSHNKIELEKKIKKKIQKLELILNNYFTKIKPYFKENLPDLKPLSKMITKFEKDLIEIKKDVNEILKKFLSKDMKLEISEIIDHWEIEYEAIKNRMQFSFKSELTNLFKEFNSILEEEQKIYNVLNDISLDTELPSYYSTEVFQSENISESEIRERIIKLSSKIGKIDKIKAGYEVEIKNFEDMLEIYLEKDGTKTKKCIICHKNVDVVKEKFVKCEFCKALSHYSCAVWWIEKYNSCPACHNKYTIPNNDLFDSNQLEK